jgi:transcriptional regulator with XRE-family HTH domain
MEKKTIKEWREEKNISREALAAALGVSFGTIANWEKDPGKMSVLKFYKLAHELGVEPDQILI